MKLSSPIYKLKRQAKLLARGRDIRLNQALNEIAAAEGFKDWSHLASRYAKMTPAEQVMRQMRAGDMVLVAARPGHGKTLLGLEMAAMADAVDRQGFVFTLDFNAGDVWEQFTTLGYNAESLRRQIIVDASDDICADFIIDRLHGAARHALVVVDYLQILDQRRTHPPLADQVCALKRFCGDSGAIFVMISQIDRAFDMSGSGLPKIEDVRLPNPVDLSLFDKRCFLHDGTIHVEMAA